MLFVFIFWFSLSGKILQLMYIFELKVLSKESWSKKEVSNQIALSEGPGWGVGVGGGTVERSEAVRARSAR